MDNIRVKILGNPTVTKDGIKISFPFAKAEALFYYLVVNKDTTRNELVSLLWGEIDEDTARKNLRNAMYHIRKSLGIDVIISPQRAKVMINPNITIETDIDRFLKYDIIEDYTGDFLQGFSVKECPSFEQWLIDSCEYYKGIYVNRLYSRIDVLVDQNNHSEIEKMTKILISLEPFDEKAYRILIELYRDMGYYNKAIDAYNKLYQVLQDELGIVPEAKTTALYEEIILQRSMNRDEGNEAKDFFYGRKIELKGLRDNYFGFVTNKESKSIIIIGEAGVGKTKLKDRFISEIKGHETYLIQADCYQVEGQYFLKPWNSIFNAISGILRDDKVEIPPLWNNVISHIFPGFIPVSLPTGINPIEKSDIIKYQVVEDAVIGILTKLSELKKIVIAIEDLQWIDSSSLNLLNSILLNIDKNRILFLATCRNEYNDGLEKFITSLTRFNRLGKIYLQRFTKEEVEEFIEKALPDLKVNNQLKENIYKETEGNAFFLAESINIIKEKGDISVLSSKIQDVLRERFLDISEEGKKLLNIISVFFDEAPLHLLKEISGKDELDIIDLMEKLQQRYIIREVKENENICYRFTHQKLREFIYSNQSMARKKIIHTRIGNVLETGLNMDKRDALLYSKLIYHFSQGGEETKALKYTIKNINLYLDLSHELFPLLHESSRGEHNLYLDRGQALIELNNIENKIVSIKSKDEALDEINLLEIAFLHMKGRYLIREGEYQGGIKCIESMISSSLRIGDYDYVLKGYRQMIYYSIQVHDTQLMKEYVDLALEAVVNNNKEKAILLRLKGLYNIMVGEYKEAKALLNESIETFTSIDNNGRYSLNIAAAYNYIGEIYRHQMKFRKAIEYYNRALNICEDKKIYRGIAIFNTNAGQASYEVGDYGMAREYLKRAIEVYNNLDSLWGRSTAEGFMALINIKDKHYQEALESIIRGAYYSSRLKNPYELGLIYRIKAEVKAKMIEDSYLNQVFVGYLDLDLEQYCEKGTNILRTLKGCYELDILKALREKR